MRTSWNAFLSIHISNNSTFPFISLHFKLSLLLSIERQKQYKYIRGVVKKTSVKFVSRINGYFSQKNNGSIFFLGKKGGGEAEGGLSKGHNFSVFFLDPFPYYKMVPVNTS